MWTSLSVDIHVAVCRYLPAKERATFTFVSRAMAHVSATAFSLYPHIKDGKLPETLGREFSSIVDIFRYGAVEIGVASHFSARARSIVHSVNDMYLLRSHGLMEDLQRLNIDMYSFWEKDYGGREGIFHNGVLTAQANPEIPYMKKVAGLQGWKQDRIHGEFYITMQRPDGAVLISVDMQKVYLVMGIAQSVAAPLIAGNRHLPVRAILTILPYEGYLVYDGLLAGALSEVSPALRRKLHKTYADAVDNNTIIYTKQNTDPSLLTSSSSGPSYDPLQLTPQQLRFQGQLKKMKKIQGQHGMWVFRRHDYTEESNPEHLLTVMGSGVPIAVGCEMSSLHPTFDDILTILKSIVVDGDGFSPSGHAPNTISTDELSIVAYLKGYMEECGIAVAYYPPPSEEEISLRGKIGGCATCGRPEMPNRPLMQCSACREVRYCNASCQKTHWKVHKKACKKK